MQVEDLIKQYIDTIVGDYCIEVEIVEDTVVLSREEMWHIYVIPGRFTMIGCFINEDIEIADKLRKCAPQIQYIYDSSKNDETVQ